MATTYNGTFPIGGAIVGVTVTAGIEDYKVGTLLERPALIYIPWAGTNPIKAVAWEEKTLAAEGTLAVVTTGSEVMGSGLFDAAGDPVTITATIVENARDQGIIIR